MGGFGGKKSGEFMARKPDEGAEEAPAQDKSYDYEGVLKQANEIVAPYGLRAEFMGDLQSVGVQGDGRTYLPILCLIGPMRTDDARLPALSNELTNKLPINRVTLELGRA